MYASLRCIPGEVAALGCSCSKDPRRKFSPGKPSPEPRAPEPPSLSRGPQPYRLSPTPAEPYGRALAKPKRWQDIQPKPTPSTHPQALNHLYKNRSYRPELEDRCP